MEVFEEGYSVMDGACAQSVLCSASGRSRAAHQMHASVHCTRGFVSRFFLCADRPSPTH